MRGQTGRQGIYRIGAAAFLLGGRKRVLEGAVPPLPAAVGATPSGGAPSAPSSESVAPSDASIAAGSAPSASAAPLPVPAAAPAAPVAPGSAADAAPVYGWVSKGLPLPTSGGLYVVEFVTGSDVRVLAYVDLYGRVFASDEPLSTPPAREPDLSYARFTDQPDSAGETGCVIVRNAEGEKVQVAQYRNVRGKYTLFDSWYDFGPHGANLSYNDAMARAFLALVHRPSLGAPAVPPRGLAHVQRRLRGDEPLGALRSIVRELRDAQADAAFCPPALVRCLVAWLEEAGLNDLDVSDAPDDALRLVRTTNYANTFYLAVDDEDADVPDRVLWGLESALNRFLLAADALGDSASLATDVDCARWDAYLLETAAAQIPVPKPASRYPDSALPGGEFAVRSALGCLIERLRLPVRVLMDMRADVEAGLVALELTVPDADLMPRWTWTEAAPPAPAVPASSAPVSSASAGAPAVAPGAAAGSWAPASPQARDAQAKRYAMHVGLALAAAAFDASEHVREVRLVMRPLAKDPVEGGRLPQAGATAFACVQATLRREAHVRTNGFEAARAGDPLPLFQACGAAFDLEAPCAFETVEKLASSEARRDMPEAREGALAGPAAEALGATDCRDLRIQYGQAHRRFAERLADRLVDVSTTADAMRVVRAAQEEAARDGDDRASDACTELMRALAEGTLDARDQNAVVDRFLGEDACLAALARAKPLAQADPGAAVDVLVEAVAQAAALDGFVDGPTTVYRTFDSYAARVLYNRARLGKTPLPASAAGDAGKQVVLATDTFYLCHLEIVRLLEQSFDRTEEALYYAKRAIAMAPATGTGYRQLGRAYMLVGDMDNAARVLKEGLAVASQPTDIAMAYYQLAYVLWKADAPGAGVACYVKSCLVDPQVAGMQASAELKELVGETGVAVPSRDQVDEELARYGVPVAPAEELLDALLEGAAAAMDVGLFGVARNLLAIRLRYRPDDALTNVLRSLSDRRI